MVGKQLGLQSWICDQYMVVKKKKNKKKRKKRTTTHQHILSASIDFYDRIFLREIL
jgi:hypothetical protein